MFSGTRDSYTGATGLLLRASEDPSDFYCDEEFDEF